MIRMKMSSIHEDLNQIESDRDKHRKGVASRNGDLYRDKTEGILKRITEKDD